MHPKGALSRKGTPASRASAAEALERFLVVPALRPEEPGQLVVPCRLVGTSLLLEAAPEREMTVMVDRARSRASLGTLVQPRRSAGSGSTRSRAPRGSTLSPARVFLAFSSATVAWAFSPAARWSRPIGRGRRSSRTSLQFLPKIGIVVPHDIFGMRQVAGGSELEREHRLAGLQKSPPGFRKLVGRPR